MEGARVLSNGHYTVFVRATGSGFSAWQGLALTSWSEDPVLEGGGLLVFLRDLDRDHVVRLGPGPWHDADGLEATLDVRLLPDADAELRRLTLENRDVRPRHLEVTTYAEIVLHDPAAHAAHPAFAKLFIETEHVEGRGLLLARRRPRSSGEPSPWLVHTLCGPGPLAWDTDRARVVGRGFTTARPRALSTAEPLGETAGSVLDPVVCCRRRVELAPGARVELRAVLGAAATRDEALALAERATTGASDEGGAEATSAPIDLPPELQAACAVVVQGSRERTARRARPAAGVSSGADVVPGTLELDTGYGGFADAGREYVVRVDPRSSDGPRLPPMPWTNVVANPEVGFIVSETGAGYTWARNSREHRLTPWSNDPIVDPHGEALWIRDEDSAVFWSPIPGPTPAPAPYEARHGFGYSAWHHTSHELEQETTLFVPRHDPLKVVVVRLVNRGATARRLSLVFYAHLVMGVFPGAPIVTEWDAASGALLARNPAGGDFADGVAFAAAVVPGGAVVGATADRATFLGQGGSVCEPAALTSAEGLDGRTGTGLDPCFAFQVTFTVAAGATVECAFLLGETSSTKAVCSLVGRYREAGSIRRAEDEARAAWRQILSSIQVSTPSPAIDVALNGWLLYQTLSCRIWGRSAFYQSGGAFGFRDQLQDSMALVHARPDLSRAEIVLHAGHQFPEGDVLHWWHPPASRGMRTRFSDDLLWLPYATAFYLHTTGDTSVLDEEAPFVTGRALAAGEDEAYLLPGRSTKTADVYSHCCLAIDRSLTRGRHGLPLMGTGDWNDGMNRVGRLGRGESVWLGFFLYDVLGSFVPICERRADRKRAGRYRRYRAALRNALERAGWDGAWYRRAYYDDGTPLGSAASDECRIDALAQAWAVISGAARRDRAARAMDAVERLLVDEEAGLVRLLAPPFDRTPHDPGYIKGYVPGIRENGGQYTHAAVWVVRAAAELGRRDRAARWLEMLTPAHHGDARRIETYKVEPYVVAADVYGVAPHVGRGGWTWYTGSAAWMYRVALESVLGVTVEGGRWLRVAPRIPDKWPGFRVRMQLGDGAVYEIRVRNPKRRAAAVIAVTLDGKPCPARMRLARDGRTHRVVVTLGSRPAPVRRRRTGARARRRR